MEVYTDGSCVSGPDNVRYAGAGVWFGPQDIRNTSVPIEPDASTNQYAELLAIKYALRLCKRVESVVIKTDSKYSINCITVWYRAWQRNNWKTSTGKDVLHSSTIKECISIVEHRESQGLSTSIVYVKGHSGIAGNEGADELARQGSRTSCKWAMDSTIFFSEGVLSQFWPTKFISDSEDGDTEYNCVEQWYHHRRALFFGDDRCAHRIMLSVSTREQRTIASGIRNYNRDRWLNECFSVVVKGNYYKFSQNLDIQSYLLSTKGMRLVAALEDDTWGIGVTVSMAKRGAKWNGLNLLGKALMKVRDEMLQ